MNGLRTINTKRNIVYGLIKQILNIVLPFITRTIVIYMLGIEYQGISSLFTSLLQVLNMADLGFATVVTYLLYKPIAENDNKSICAIIAFLRKIYRYVGITILLIGSIISPFLSHLIVGEYPNDINIYILYFMYLINAAISYLFFAYKSALITSMQREDIVSNITSITSVAVRLVQIVTLILTKNFYIFVAVMIAGTLLNNIMLQIVSKKLYPKLVPVGNINSETKAQFLQQIKGIVLNKVGDTARNSFDNIILSSFLGLSVVAIYDNYFYVYSALYGITLVIIHAMQASVGNSIVMESVNKNYMDLQKFTFIFSWFSGWCTVCMMCLYQPFMRIWLNNQQSMLLSNIDMILFCVYFYAITMNNTRNLYVNGTGMFWELRLWYVLEAVGNLVLNVVLGYFWGVTGVIVATITTIILFNFIARTNVLFNKYFCFSPKEFYLTHAYYGVATTIGCGLTYCLCIFVPFNGVLELIVKATICVFVPNIIFFVVYRKNQNYLIAKDFIINRVLKKH